MKLIPLKAQSQKKIYRGILLLELMIATMLISFALIGIVNAYRAALEAESYIETQALARILIQQKIAELEIEAHYAEGATAGLYQEHWQTEWSIVTVATNTPGLFRHEITIKWPQDELKSTVYLKEQKSEEN